MSEFAKSLYEIVKVICNTETVQLSCKNTEPYYAVGKVSNVYEFAILKQLYDFTYTNGTVMDYSSDANILKCYDENKQEKKCRKVQHQEYYLEVLKSNTYTVDQNSAIVRADLMATKSPEEPHQYYIFEQLREDGRIITIEENIKYLSAIEKQRIYEKKYENKPSQQLKPSTAPKRIDIMCKTGTNKIEWLEIKNPHDFCDYDTSWKHLCSNDYEYCIKHNLFPSCFCRHDLCSYYTEVNKICESNCESNKIPFIKWNNEIYATNLYSGQILYDLSKFIYKENLIKDECLYYICFFANEHPLFCEESKAQLMCKNIKFLLDKFLSNECKGIFWFKESYNTDSQTMELKFIDFYKTETRDTFKINFYYYDNKTGEVQCNSICDSNMQLFYKGEKKCCFLLQITK